MLARVIGGLAPTVETLPLSSSFEPGRSVPVDFDGDGLRTVADLMLYDDVLAGAPYNGPHSLDLLEDGVVDERDRAAMLASYVGSCTSDDLLALQVKPAPGHRLLYVPTRADMENDVPAHLSGAAKVSSLAVATRICAGNGGLIVLGPGVHDAYVGGGWQNDAISYGGKPGSPLIIATDPLSPTRAILRLPQDVGAGARFTDDVSHVTLRGLHLVCGRGQNGIVISGTASHINIVDCIIDGGAGGADGNGGATGIQIEGSNQGGVDKRPTRIVIAYCMIFGQNFGDARRGIHCQGIYASNYTELDIFNNVFWRCGKLGSATDQAIYLVHGAKTRPRVNGNFIGMPGSACIQMRGTDMGEAGWNIGFWCNTFLGLGHPMGYRDGVFSSVRAHNNLGADPRQDGTAPARWGISHMAGAINDMSHNVLRGFPGGGIAGPSALMTGQDQGGLAASVPPGEFRITGLRVSHAPSGVDWLQELAVRLSRQHGTWDENAHGTRRLIELVRARTPLVA